MPSDEPDPYTVHDDALPDIDLNASTHPIRDALQLESADPVTLFHALTAVERALPHLLLCLKPILASLTSSNNEALVREHPLAEALAEREVDEESEEKEEAGRAVVDFLAIVDDIQDTLRQTALYLKATGASPTTLVPPPVSAIPTPFASTLPPGGAMADTGEEQGTSVGPELGLYASRIESRTLAEMVEVLGAMKSAAGTTGAASQGHGAADNVRGGGDMFIGDSPVGEEGEDEPMG